MSDVVIRVEALGKRYRIGERQKYKALRDVLAGALQAPWHAARSLARNGRAGLTREKDDQTIWALKDVSFEVEKGEVVGIIGRNGAGKSTLLKVLSRITEPTEGHAKIRGRIGSLLEVGTGFHPELTGRENVYLNGAILGMRKAEIDRSFDEIVDFSGIERFIDTPVKHYSSGMYVRLAFAVAAHLETEILLVDEVLAVGDAQFQKKCLGKMEHVASEGRTILFVSHNMAAVEHLCSKGILIEEGCLVRQGNSTAITSFYLDRAKNQVESRQISGWPIFSADESIGISGLKAKIIQDEADQLGKLVVEMEVIARQPIKKIGVGIALTTTRGVLVSNVKPAMTNYVIYDVQGNYNCVFECPEIGRYLASGEYYIGAWLSWPNVEYLVRVEDAARVTVPPFDIYGEGVGFELVEHGLVPLPMAFTFSHLG
jgi:lipopolysaccharide transport system ATP-binding protein